MGPNCCKTPMKQNYSPVTF